ncbi:MAG: D-alanine--D-alanine ligase [Acidobacteria bacterium]|nr:D-alanine--D-alanine ligase [Acidobacteriota bacterium]
MGVGEPTRVAVLMGGVSSEHDVSICTGLNVLDALRDAGYAAMPVYLARDGAWHFDYRPVMPSLSGDANAAAGAPPSTSESLPVFETLSGDLVEVAFIALHGPGGEDGAIQGLCETAGLRFTGSGVMASAMAMDKHVSKRLLTAVNIPMPSDVVVRSDAPPSDVEASIAEVGLPCVVKPVAGGSSFATAVAHDTATAVQAAAVAAASGAVMIESFLDGVEVTCGVLGGGPESTLALPLTEIVPVADTFFDFRAKYTAAACEEITPARVDPAVAAQVQELAVRAHLELGCEGCSRSDFIITADGPQMLELNTIPGMTETSLLPQGAAAAGISFGELVDRLVQAALTR